MGCGCQANDIFHWRYNEYRIFGETRLTRSGLLKKVALAFRQNDELEAWNLVVQNIAGKKGKGLLDSDLTADCVPSDLTWETPSLVQAFALTFEGDGWQQPGGLTGKPFLNEIETDSGTSAVEALSLTELRASLYALQRRWHDSDGEPDGNFVATIVGEIRKRFAERDAVWRGDALIASIEAYLSMMANEEASRPSDRTQMLRDLATRFGRPAKDFKGRLGDISYVLAASGEAWILDINSPSNIESGEVAEILRLISEAKARLGFPVGVVSKSRLRALQNMADVPPGTPWPFYRDFSLSDDNREPEASLTTASPPVGVLRPPEVTSIVVTRARDAAVKAWVLRRANGQCECCAKTAPFMDKDGLPFLEIHHLRMLAQLGSDRHTNAVAVCPNCHRHLHHGQDSQSLVLAMYEKIPELVSE